MHKRSQQENTLNGEGYKPIDETQVIGGKDVCNVIVYKTVTDKTVA
ncbi:hypothetical protein [Xenorhabdus santafensis]|nr:hypothetical protein [Xenorhabdus sp. 12]